MRELSIWGGDFAQESRLDRDQDKYIDNTEAPKFGYRKAGRIHRHNEAIELDRSDDLTQE